MKRSCSERMWRVVCLSIESSYASLINTDSLRMLSIDPIACQRKSTRVRRDFDTARDRAERIRDCGRMEPALTRQGAEPALRVFVRGISAPCAHPESPDGAGSYKNVRVAVLCVGGGSVPRFLALRLRRVGVYQPQSGLAAAVVMSFRDRGRRAVIKLIRPVPR